MSMLYNIQAKNKTKTNKQITNHRQQQKKADENTGIPVTHFE